MIKFERVLQRAPDGIRRLFAIPGADWTDGERREFIEWLRRVLRQLADERSARPARRPRVQIPLPVDTTAPSVIADSLWQYRPSADRPFDLQFAEFLDECVALPFVLARGITQIGDDRLRQILIEPKLERLDAPELATELRFQQLEDFDPATIAREIPALAQLLTLRKQLNEIVGRGLRSKTGLSHLVDALTPREISGERTAGAVGDWIECTVFGPKSIARRGKAMVQAFAHKPERSGEAARLAREFDPEAGRLATKGLGVQVPHGTRLTFTLTAPDLQIRGRTQSLVWQGRTANVSFAVRVPPDAATGATIGTVTVKVADVPIGQLNILITITEQGAEAVETSLTSSVRRYKQAFVSYASRDRTKVLERVQMLRLQGIKYFQDVLDLEPGARWAQELYRHIDDCDLFLLFWSGAARKSRWVMKEVRYAFDRQHGDHDAPPTIHPVIVARPSPLPPRYLKHLHFDDKLTYFMKRPRA